MVTPNLNQRHHLVVAGIAVLGTTLAAGLTTVLDPAIAASTAPHPTLTGSLDDWLGITSENLRVLAAPFLLCLLGAEKCRLGRRAGDVVVIAVIAVNATPVGIALERWQSQLIPYLPQLPLEWAALTLTVSAWLTIRTTTATRQQIVGLATSTALLVLAAATLETWLTPHRPAPVQASREAVDAVYLPKCSSNTQLLEAKEGIQRMLVEVPLTEDERAAVESDDHAVMRLIDLRADVATPASPTPRQVDARRPQTAAIPRPQGKHR